MNGSVEFYKPSMGVGHENDYYCENEQKLPDLTDILQTLLRFYLSIGYLKELIWISIMFCGIL